MTEGREEWMTEGLDTSGNPFRPSTPDPPMNDGPRPPPACVIARSHVLPRGMP